MMMTMINKRKSGLRDVGDSKLTEVSVPYETEDSETNPASLIGCFWLTRIIFLRFLCFIYIVAFSVAFQQNEALIGEYGLTPATLFMQKLKQNFGEDARSFMKYPTLFWFLTPTSVMLKIFAATGAALAGIVCAIGAANMIIMLVLWLLYISIVNVGQTWYSFGWESQLLETGFLAIFMVPLISLSQFPKLVPTPIVCVWGYRWLLFRIMIGAGLIKIRGDQCWRDLTCMNYFYQTQPVPNPLSPFFHAFPSTFHSFETMSNHFIELFVPWMLFMPRIFRISCGLFQIIFQVILISAGNLSFLNWLTIAPALMYFDDLFLGHLFTTSSIRKALLAEKSFQSTANSQFGKSTWFLKCQIYLRRILALILFIVIANLSIPVINNLLSPNQAMNTNFDAFRIVNTYGAFGSVTKTRMEVILEGSSDDFVDDHTNWYEFEFKCKPGNIDRRPCLITPWHFRLDWLMWFAAFQNYAQNPWLVHLSVKLMRGDTLASNLFATNGNPFFLNGTKPKFIRAQHYEYIFNTDKGISVMLPIWSDLRKDEKEKEKVIGWITGKWWKRRLVSEYMPPITVEDPSVLAFLKHYNWD